jgi:hypothetical protein
MWTTFLDMHSGGDQKEKWGHIFIEAPEDEAQVIFYNRFGHNPNRVTCTCCGNDYSVDEHPTLEEATEFHRKGRTVEEYRKDPTVLIVPKSKILDSERKGTVPPQGYVWVD